MAQVLTVDIEGTDYGPNGLRVVRSVSAEAASFSRNGSGSIQLIYPYGAGYSFFPTQEVRVYRTNAAGTSRYGILGGFVNKVTYATTMTAIPANAYTVATIECVDYNRLLDTISTDGTETPTISIASGTFLAQVTELVQEMQENGNATVSRAIDVSRVTNLTGATTYPAFTIEGKSLRMVLRERCALAQADDPDLRPRFGLMLDDDGVGGVHVTLAVWDGAIPPSSMLTLAYQASGVQRSVRAITRTLDGGMPIINRRQGYFTAPGTDGTVTAIDGVSVATYFNRYINHDLAGNVGYWTLPPIDLTNAETSGEAQSAIDQTVAAVAYPRETLTIQYDKPSTDTTFLTPGRGVTVNWPPFNLTNVLYEVAAVHVDFPNPKDSTYERLAVTLGLPLLELFENGTDGAARAPIISAPKLPKPTWNGAYTTGIDKSGQGWVTASIVAVPGAVTYRYYYRLTSSGPYIFITESDSTTVTMRNVPVPSTRYLVASGVNAAGKEGFRSDNKTVAVGYVPDDEPGAASSWDIYDADDEALRGLEVLVGLSADVLWLTTPLYSGKATLKLINEDSGITSVLGPKITCAAGDVLVVGAARRRSAASGTATSGLLARFYDSADALIGAATTIFSAIATTSFVYTEDRATAPAGTVYARWLLEHDASSGITSTSSYFSYPAVKRTVPAKQLDLRTDSGTRVEIKDANGNVKMGIYYNVGSDTIVLETDDEDDSNIELRSGGGFVHIGSGISAVDELFTSLIQIRAALFVADGGGYEFPDNTVQTTAMTATDVYWLIEAYGA